jgi:metal-responsive CopG/Arc/MetJ family transcriptional regulator
MPPKDKIIPVPMKEDLLKRVEDFRYENRIASRADAIRRLLEVALSKHEKKAKK